MISIIVCTDENGLFAYNDNSLAPPNGDLKRFRLITSGHVVIMGRATWESLPVNPLPDRENIVVARLANHTDQHDNLTYCQSLVDAIQTAISEWPWKQIFLIGGEQIYNEGLFFADRILRTVIHHKVPENCIGFDPRYFHIPKEGWLLTAQKDYGDHHAEVYERC